MGLKEQDAELKGQIAQLDIAALAESLRPGKPRLHAEMDIDRVPQGNINVHIPLEFEDGVKWMARIRRMDIMSAPRLIGREIMLGEMDTLRWLGRQDGVPVPQVRSGINSKSL